MQLLIPDVGRLSNSNNGEQSDMPYCVGEAEDHRNINNNL